MYQKRLSAPKTYTIQRKVKPFVAIGRGPHSRNNGIPLLVVLRDILKVGENRREIKKILSSGSVFVDGKVRKDEKMNLGFMDIVEIPELKKTFRVGISRKGFLFNDVKNNGKKIGRINKIVNVKGGKYQVTLHDGKTILSDEKLSTGNSLIIGVPSLKILEEVKMEKGNEVIVMFGKHRGRIAKIVKLENNKAFLKDNEEFHTRLEYICPVKNVKEFLGSVTGDGNE